MPIKLDKARFPLVLVTYDGPVNDLEFDAYLAEMETLVRSRRSITCTILDARRAVVAPARQRKMQADWLARNRHLLEMFSAGTVFVIDSPIIRGVLTAILWLAPIAGTHAIVETMMEAERWARERLLLSRPVETNRGA